MLMAAKKKMTEQSNKEKIEGTITKEKENVEGTGDIGQSENQDFSLVESARPPKKPPRQNSGA
jgi:hypothetical protein